MTRVKQLSAIIGGDPPSRSQPAPDALPRPLRLALVIPWLACGGAERVAVTLARGFVRRGHTVCLVTLGSITKDFFSVPIGVRRVALDLQAEGESVVRNGVTSVRQIAALRRTLVRESPDVVVAFMSATNILTTLALARSRIPVVATEHNPRGLPPLGPIWGPLQRLTYRHVARIVSVSEAIDRGYGWVPAARRAVIYNPLDSGVTPPVAGKEAPAAARRTVVGIGRLVSVNAVDVLVHAFARIASRLHDCDLVIVGDGPERASLETLRDRLGLANRVRFPGLVTDVAQWLAGADVFVSPSRSGGVGCAAIEALASGVPVVATLRPGAAAEVVHDGVNGLRVPVDDIEGMAAAIGRLMEDRPFRGRLAAHARRAAVDLDVMSVVPAWERLFADLVRR